ncbi:Maf family protein [Cellulosimicrobium marinum]|uniref:Maf family protein n=1 Tax=Cellulosimicrobium marinum TaxID=1638992 RepID=UPI001E560706|nr:nucleoside triphosphate pyrophosphatase [Cellulosimicrobium marinum]MCB7136466.1 Maf family nucleotide pyrophosphatase [Cellulosimicrobium marinum]
MLRLVLASRSPARLATLRAAGVDPAVRVSDVDEDAVLRDAAQRYGDLDPVDAVLVLARAKAEEVTRVLEAEQDDTEPGDTEPGDTDLLVGCDSMLELDGEVLGKPRDADDARARWRAMRGRAGVLHTGHWLVDLRHPDDGGTGATFGATASTTVHFADLTDAEIDAYVATGEPLHVAGAFTVDGLGGPYVERIEGDHHNVVGISLPLLRGLLDEVGVAWHELRS